jgi:hypothetical protein
MCDVRCAGWACSWTGIHQPQCPTNKCGMKNDGLLPGLKRLGVTVEAHFDSNTESSASEDASQVAQELHKMSGYDLVLLFEVIISAITKSPTAMQVSDSLTSSARISPVLSHCMAHVHSEIAVQHVRNEHEFFVSNLCATMESTYIVHLTHVCTVCQGCVHSLDEGVS